MQPQLWLSVVLICYTFATINTILSKLDASIAQQSFIPSTVTSSFTTRSKTSIEKQHNFTWNGGIILSHESNVQSWKGRSETAIASTRCGNIIFVGFNSAQGFCFDNDENDPICPGVPNGFYNGVSHYAVSLNGGKTWKYMYGPPPLDSDIYARSDPWLSMGGKSSKYSQELLYFSNLASNKSTTINDVIGLSVHVARIIYKNDNPQERAVNFEWIRASLIPKIQSDDFLDKEAIAADPFDANKAYVTYTQLGGDRFNIEFYATHNAAVSWQGPLILQETNRTLSNRWNGMTYPVVSANGDVYIIWYEFTLNTDLMTNLKYQFLKSIDGGVTFPDPAITINTFPESDKHFNPILQPPVAYNRNSGQPQTTMDVFTTVSVDNNRHNYLNRIIVAWWYSVSDSWDGQLTGFIDDDSPLLNSINIAIYYSDDRGATWYFINPFKEDIPMRFVKRIFPTVSVSSDGRSVNVAYLEIKEVKKQEICEPLVSSLTVRTSYYHSIVDTYYIHSDNGGITWSDPIKLNDESIDWCTTYSNIRPNYGDYMLGISDSKGHLHLAGVSNGFTLVSGFEPLTAVDVIYYNSKKKKKKCNKGKRWRKGIYNALFNEEYEHKRGSWSELENKNENIEIDVSWTVIVVAMCGIAMCAL
eukprot:337491_1